VAVGLALVWPPLAIAFCVGVPLPWFIPDRQMESKVDR